MLAPSLPNRILAWFFRRLPSFRGKTRLIRILNRVLLLCGVSPLIQADISEGKFILDLRSRTEAIPFYLGYYDKEMTNFLNRVIKEFWTVIDVGANIGFMTMPLGKLVGPAGKIICFEPLNSNFDRLLKNIRDNKYEDRTQCFKLALSDQSGELKLGLFEDFKIGASTGNAAPLEANHPPPTRTTIVPRVTLDTWVTTQKLERLDFIKIDIEGHEDAFFKGAVSTIERYRPLILGEFSEAHMKAKKVDVDVFFQTYFAPRQYRAYRISKGRLVGIKSLKGRGGTDDIFLSPDEKLALLSGIFNQG